MNVVHVFPYTPRVAGGHANAIRGFIACQRAKQINAVGIAPKPDGPAAETSWEFPLAEVDSLWDLRWADLARRFDIRSGDSLVNLHTVNRRNIPLLAELRRARVPYVMTSHGQFGFQNQWRWFMKFVYLHLLNRSPIQAAGLHLLTRFAAQRVRFLLPGFKGITLAQGNLVTVPNLAELPTASKGDYALPEDSLVLMFLGRLDVWVKGLDILVEAFSCLPSKHCHLVLVGPDWQDGQSQLEHLGSRFGCGDRMHFTGPVYGARKWSLLQMADVFVSPSRWEAFSIAQAEAMACGLPVVTSTKVNLALELRESDAALLIPPRLELLAKALASLAADRDRRRALGKRGKAWMERNCDPGPAGARFLEFYQSILERNQAARG